MKDKDVSQVDHLLSRSDKIEMIAPLSRLAVMDDCMGIGVVWFASGRDFHSSEGFPPKAELALFLPDGTVLRETQHTRGWFPSVCWHRRVFEDGKLVVRELKFIAGEAVFNVLELINQTSQPMDLKLVLRGRASAKGNVSFRDGRVHIDEEQGRTLEGTYTILAAEPKLKVCRLDFEDMEISPFFEPGPKDLYGERIRYLAGTEVHLEPEGRAKAAVALSWEFSKQRALAQLPKNLLKADSLLPELKEGWKTFWEESVPKLSVPDQGLQKLYYYAWYVMRAQMMPPQGRLPHIYVAPTKFAHVGVWLQDHAYIGIGSRWLNNVGLSQNSIRLLTKNQFSNGLIPSSINAYGVRAYDKTAGRGLTLDIRDMGRHSAEEVPSQLPPAFTIAADEVFMKTGNLDFLKECYQAAIKLDDWMAGEREDGDGLFKAVHLMDIEHLAGGRRIEGHDFIKAVDVSALNVYHRRLIQRWGSILGETRKLDVIGERAERTARSIFERCWDIKRQFFYDLLPDGSLSPVETAAGFYTLFASQEVAADTPSQPAIVDALLDPKRFWTPVPVPTVSMSCGGSGQGVSQSVDWFVINGLIRQNFKEPAEKMVRKLLQAHLPHGLPESKEGFDAHTGEGKGCPDFAWVGLAVDLLMTCIMGIRPQRTALKLEPWLPISWEQASVKGLRLGPHSIDLSYDVGKTASTIRIRTFADKGASDMPVDIRWRTRPGERISDVSPNGEIGASYGFPTQDRQVAHLSLVCPANSETVVNIRTRKA